MARSKARHYGWPVSPYSAKTRSYLLHKGIPFVDETPSFWTLERKVKRAVGKVIMPTVCLPNGEWLQDSSSIIDAFEALYPKRQIRPAGPTQSLASSLLELYADEWMPMAALHYRWNLPENADFAMREFVRYAIPGVPFFVGKRAVTPVALRLRGYLPLLGVKDEVLGGVERATEGLVADLEVHLREHSFLLGERPCLGDFSLFGPLYAHLYRDPASQVLFRNAPAVVEWMKRLHRGGGESGSFVPDDQVPDTLSAVFRRMASEQVPFLLQLFSALEEWAQANPDGDRPPKLLGWTGFQVGGVEGSRAMISFVQWKAQRAWDLYADMPAVGRARTDEWLESVGLRSGLSRQPGCRLERRSFRIFRESSPEDCAQDVDQVR